ncbi:MAG TPA: FAD-dependent oxidoreductase [Chroococcales cyanobacterium]
MFKPFRLPVSARFIGILLAAFALVNLAPLAVAQENAVTLARLPRTPDQTVECEILVAGGGLAGTATAYEALLAGRTVCMTDITDWIGGQLTSQGTSAFDEAQKQRSLLFYSRGYKELRQRIERKYGMLNPGDCWVSVSCFIPKDGYQLLVEQLRDAEKKGKGKLKWFPSTVIKELEYSADGKMINGVIAIEHSPVSGTPPLNTEPLSKIIEDAYRYENSPRLTKQIIHFVPQPFKQKRPINWLVVDATETGELVALADVPYRLGIDPRSYRNPSSPTETGDPYCTQAFTYTFAMEQTKEVQPQQMPSFYPQYEPFYSYDGDPKTSNFDYVFTYRRIWSPEPRSNAKVPPFNASMPKPGDIAMQNWGRGNDYGPGSAEDNLVYTREQLSALGQLSPGGWLGGLRTDTLRKGEEMALGFYYWLVEGTTDSELQPSVKQPAPNHRLLTGLDSPMGTVHGLSKYPYIREGRRIIGRPSLGYQEGFSISEIDISRVDYSSQYYRDTLSAQMYRDLWTALSGLEGVRVIRQGTAPNRVTRRTRSTIYPDAVGIAQYAIDFHPCMKDSPPERPGNVERPGVRQAHGQAYPAQIPLRAMIPQKIDNLLVAGKSIATSYIAAAAYRVHSFEWSVGAAAGTTAAFALSEGLLPYQLVDELPKREPQLEKLQKQLQKNGNPTAFPDTSIFNERWDDWKVW